MRIVVYVEGKTELIFIREFLRKWYDYDESRLAVRCMELRASEAFDTEYSFGSEDADRHITIVSVGGDRRTLSKALKNAPEHRNRGFDKVLVLRDMYCADYVEEAQGRVIDPLINERFIKGAEDTISLAGFSGFVFCNFAIMEIEAWLLGMGWYLENVDSKLNQRSLLDVLSYDLELDPEIVEFQPAKRLKEIYNHVNLDYDKHGHEINSIMSHLNKDDFQMLFDLEKCASFNSFVKLLTN